MAVYNEILAGRFNRALQKLMSMKGPPPAPQLSSELMPILYFFQGIEERFLHGWNVFASGAIVAAVAAQNTAWQIRNPASSGVVAVIGGLSVFTSVADPALGITQNTGAADLGTAIAARCLDNRSAVPSAGSTTTLGAACRISSTNNIASSGGFVHFTSTGVNVEQGLISDEDGQLLLLPGDSLQFLTSVTNVKLAVNIRWRERVLEDSEKF
jgi:hypothetical protein